jgi:uncharacterized membrane protein
LGLEAGLRARGIWAAAAALVAALPIAVATAAAGSLPDDGAVVRDHLRLLGHEVPLPPGEWVVLGHGFGRVEGPSPGPYGALVGVMAAHRAGERIDAVVLATTNALPVEAGWGPPPQCGAAGMAFASEIKQQARNLSCAFVPPPAAAAAALDRLPGWDTGAAEAARRGWVLPVPELVAGLRVSDRHDVVDVRYLFAPIAVAGPGDQLATLAAWSEGAEQRLAASLQLLPAMPGALAWPAPAAPPPDPEAGELSAWQLALYKMMTLRVIGSTITFGVAYLFTGSLYGSVAMVVVQAVTHSALYFANELYWEQPTIPPALAFVATGRES